MMFFSNMSPDQSELADPENILEPSNVFHPLVVNNLKDLNSTHSSTDTASPLYTFLVRIYGQFKYFWTV